VKIQIEQLDLLAPWPAITMREGYYAVRVIVRAGTVSIGDVFCRPVRGRLVTPRRLQRRIARKYGQRIVEMLGTPGTSEIDDILDPTGSPQAVREAFVEKHGPRSWPTPGVTVAVVTHGDEALLAACLCNLKQLDYPDFGILVVDNGNDPVPTRDLAEALGVSYLRCLTGKPGRARNAAIEHARTEWVAFIDDDCRPERDWLRQLVRPAAEHPGCRCVCGMVQPARLESAADVAFEIHRGLAQRFDEIVLRRDVISASTRPAPLWRLGSTANLLVHRQFVQLIGGFDANLPCKEAADLLYRALLDDYSVHYAPSALVHHHRTWTRKSLRKYIQRCAAAVAAYHVQRMVRYGDVRSLLELVWHRPKALTCDLVRALRGKSKYPWPLVLVELRATIAGPWRYVIETIRRKWKSRTVRLSKAPRAPRRYTPDSASSSSYATPPPNPTHHPA